MIIARMYTGHSFRGWRAKPRKAMRLEIQASTGADGARALVRDLSEYGLRLETAAELTVGDRFEVNLPMAENVLAEVVWSDSNSHGCKFLRPVPRLSLVPPPSCRRLTKVRLRKRLHRARLTSF